MDFPVPKTTQKVAEKMGKFNRGCPFCCIWNHKRISKE
jgi:hypothetical protein